MKLMTGEPVIVVDAEVMSGTPCFRGTRVPFKNLIDYVEGGHALGDFLDQFPTVMRRMPFRLLKRPRSRCSRESREDSAG